MLHRIRGPFNVSTPAQVAGIAALETSSIRSARAHNDRWLPWLGQELSELGLEVHPSVANFVLVAFEAAGAHRGGGERLARATGRHRPTDGRLRLPDCLRLSVGLEDENRAAVAALREFMA